MIWIIHKKQKIKARQCNCIFLLKFHCKLNPIEMVYSFNLISILDTVLGMVQAMVQRYTQRLSWYGCLLCQFDQEGQVSVSKNCTGGLVKLLSCYGNCKLTPRNLKRGKYYVETLTPIVGHPKKYTGISVKGVFVCFQPPWSWFQTLFFWKIFGSGTRKLVNFCCLAL